MSTDYPVRHLNHTKYIEALFWLIAGKRLLYIGYKMKAGTGGTVVWQQQFTLN